MSCPNAAGTITSSPLPDVSITDRSAALPAAVPDVLLLCEHFMARHILCFHITDKFVLSLSHWPLPDSLNDVVQLRELTLSQSNLGRFRQDVHKTPATAATHTQPHMCINVHKHSYTHTHTWATWAGATTDSLIRSRGQAFCEEGGWGEEGWWIKFIFMRVISSPNTLL